MAKDTLSKQDCMDYKKVETFAKQKNCTLRNGKGSHAIIEYKNSQLVYVRRNMGYGLACAIYKWFKLVGLLSIIIMIGVLVWQMQ